MAISDHLSFAGRRLRGRGRRRFWSKGYPGADETLADLGRARADEFLKYVGEDPAHRHVLDRIVADMPTPLGPMEVAFLARMKAVEL